MWSRHMWRVYFTRSPQQCGGIGWEGVLFPRGGVVGSRCEGHLMSHFIVETLVHENLVPGIRDSCLERHAALMPISHLVSQSIAKMVGGNPSCSHCVLASNLQLRRILPRYE